MKVMLIIIFIILNLDASIFASENKKEKLNYKQNIKIHESFRKNVSDANAIIKRGEYQKVSRYEDDSLSIIKQIEELDVATTDKTKLKEDLTRYSQLVNNISSSLQNEAPRLNNHYRDVINRLDFFNSKLASIGLVQLLDDWHDLSRIKNRFVKKPSAQLEKRFNEKWTVVIVTITELYLDEKIEDPLFSYLENYKAYFQEIKGAYTTVNYTNVKKLKPLSYKIKAQLELLAPYSI